MSWKETEHTRQTLFILTEVLRDGVDTVDIVKNADRYHFESAGLCPQPTEGLRGSWTNMKGLGRESKQQQ